MKKYIYKTAGELARMIREGKARSYDVVKEHLEHIKEHNGKLNALISVFEEEALKEAAECDKEASEGKFRGPLHGVPVTIKEQYWIRGKKSNVNFKMLRDFVAPENAVVVDRIINSGAIILGQTNVPRTLIDYQVQGDIYPVGKNPYNTEYTPGGSTGGGAAALAAGFTTLELGSDFGGSIRVPSNFCGLYGLKPTERTIPLHGNMPLPKNARTFLVQMVTAGPLARNIEDLELLWKIIVGPHENDRSAADINWKEPRQKTLSEYKIAWTDGWPGYETSSQVSDLLQSFSEKLGSNGCRIEKRIPNESLHRESLMTYVGIFPYVIAQGTSWIIRQIIRRGLFRGLLHGMRYKYPDLLKSMNNAFRMNANHYGEMMLKRNLVTKRWEQFFAEYDFLVCPVAFGPAFRRCRTGAKIPYEGKEILYIDYVWPYVACFNASGNPSIAVPLGVNDEGLPVGVQIVGKYWSEPDLIQLVKLLQPLLPGFIPPKGFE